MRRAKTAEVTTNLGAIYSGIEGRFREHGRVDPIPLTPSDVPCGDAHVWTAQELGRFAATQFSPAQTH